MAHSTCGKCGNHAFEMREVAPSGSAFKLYFVQCTSCGVPIGVTEYYNSGAKMDEMEKRLTDRIKTLEGYVDTVNQNIGTILRVLNSMPKQ